MKRRFYAKGILAVFLCSAMMFAATRQWHNGKLMDTEQQKVKEGSTTMYHANGDSNATANTTDNIDTYEVYTIRGAEKTYVAREKLLFPWSKPANVTVGSELKYAIDGRKLIILDEDNKEHKASIVKTSMNQ